SNASEFDFSSYSYVADCVDTVAAKLEIVAQAKSSGIPVISAMGAGNKLEASMFEVSDIYKTSICPLAKVMRRELRKLGIEDLKVVYSREEPKNVTQRTPGSVAFAPSVMGLIMAGEIVKDLTGL
nr:ThiF family adenylyltransferase [Saccharofermentans sp.]